MSSLQRFFKDTIIYGVAAVLPKAINILLTKLHTEKLETDKFAENTWYFVFAAYFIAFLTFGLETAFFRFFSKEMEKGKIVSTSFITLITSTVLFLIILLTFNTQLSQLLGFDNPLHLKILTFVTAFDLLVVIPYAYLRVTNKPIKFAFYRIANILIYAFFNLFFLWFIPHAIKNNIALPSSIVDFYQSTPTVVFIFIANLIASFVTFILLLPSMFKFGFDFDKKILQKMLAYGIPIMIGGLAYVTNENLDKLLLGDIIGKDQMGIYAACYKLGVFMTLYITAFKLGAEPYFFNQAEKANAKENYAKILTWFTIIGALFMLLVVVYIDFLASFIIAKEYFGALAIVPIILLANLLLGVYNNLSVWYKLTDKTKYGMYFSIIGAIITIVLNIIFIPKYGFMASAWATLIAYASMTLISYFYGKKYYNVPYKMNKVLLYVVLSFGLSILSYYQFKDNYYISTLFVLAFLTFILINEKNEIKTILKK
ncbi:polysaccharide biosynthesis C-terminal domain-containing protein [Aureibaculum sp. 2210JD6-5]|uniref:lipopolysaccharide biosynthesis protein n=1 Tax=Aureibaculum sp. 2210JD6-5 TaxID=3103957 RepID=UPI002AAD2903|nr:polysaccharide biosynthesis C-terminal domain-containing protein [Aureibaculum sp. 2210JD6-5]MDY7394922.1 polysaccharide biosynthesis C-terminal domain-containing protein [Aureibaculum sp. 2210JD6-5]